MKKFISKPQHWQDFEDLIKKLYGEAWGCSDTIEKNGRNGNDQSGVDIYAFPREANKYWAIQCKGKDDYTNKNLTISEIDKEIAKAMNFDQPLEKFIFATTGNKSIEIQKYIRKKDVELRKKHGMQIHVVFWDGIDELLEDHKNVLNWYEGKHQKNYDVSILFPTDTIETSIIPIYERTKRRWTKNESEYQSYQNTLKQYRSTITGIHQRNMTMCDAQVLIKNIGPNNLKDYRIEFIFDPSTYLQLSDSNNPGAMSIAFIPTRCNGNMITYTAKEVLNRGATVHFQIYIQPHERNYTIPVEWTILGEDDYEKKGTLHIKVVPDYIEYLELYPLKHTDEDIPEVIEIIPHKK